MLGRTYPNQTCSIARALEVVGERWTLLILRDAFLGARRFDDFRSSLGIATNVLATRLDHLVQEGLLERRVGPEDPRPAYALTDKGRAMGSVLVTLLKWGDAFYPAEGGPPRLTLHAGCGGTVDGSFRCERCGARPAFDAIELQPGPGLPAQRPFETVARPISLPPEQ